MFSRHYGVTALGNIATHPAFRGQGLATRTCAKLMQALQQEGVTHVGLNVRADNAAAIACYQRLGFAIVAEYCECTVDAL